MNSIQTTSIIRNRGQITIPDKIRRSAPWADTSSVISISLDEPEKITIQPHKTSAVDAEKIWKMVSLSRSLKGKPGSASKFIAKDRHGH